MLITSVNVFVHHTYCTLEVVTHWISSLWSPKFTVLPFRIKCSKVLNANRRTPNNNEIRTILSNCPCLIKKKGVSKSNKKKTFTVRDLVKCSLSDIRRLIQQKGFTLKQNDPWNPHPVVLQR